MVVRVKNLKREFLIEKKRPGLSGLIRGLVKSEETIVKAVDGISFEVDEGELVGFIGPNGAGKTTTLKTLSGLLYPSAGDVEVFGFKPWERDHNFLKKYSLVMGQKNQLWWDLPVIESVRLNKEIYGIDDGSFEEIFGELCEVLEAKPLLNTQARKLSLGQRMKMELLTSLIHSPKLLFLDEPTIGLDVVMQKKLRDFIHYYNKKHNSTILLTSHYMEDVKELCKRVIIIDKGKLVYDGDLEKVTRKFADHKIVTVMLSKPVERERLDRFPGLSDYDWPKAKFKVKRSQVRELTQGLFGEFEVEDIAIEETKIEEVIREIFSGEDVA